MGFDIHFFPILSNSSTQFTDAQEIDMKDEKQNFLFYLVIPVLNAGCFYSYFPCYSEMPFLRILFDDKCLNGREYKRIITVMTII